MHLTVLGAAGSLGRAFVHRAVEAGHEVRAVVRTPAKAEGLPPQVEVVTADLLDILSLGKACNGTEVIVHAANVPYPAWPKVLRPMATNVLKIAKSLRAILAFPGNVFVYGRPRTRPVTEDHPQEPHTVKGRIRLEIERRFLEAHREGRIRLVLPRYPDFYGPGVVNDLTRSVFGGALRGKPCRWPLDVDGPHEWIYIDDAAEALLALLETPEAYGRAVHVPGPGTLPPREFIYQAYKAAGHEPKIRVVGRRTMRIYSLFDASARATYEMLYLYEDHLVLDGALYRALVGSPPPALPYEEGIPRTLEWFRTHAPGK